MTKDDVDHVALLSRLELTEIQRDQFTRQLNEIVEQIDLLQQLDTTDVPPTAHILALQNVYQTAQEEPRLTKEEALANCADHDDSYFIVPKIM
jgi:aspartyl-tRNA(Asn)/glutamyl-tRNA(Gln) amidotransferase subunit C